MLKLINFFLQSPTKLKGINSLLLIRVKFSVMFIFKLYLFFFIISIARKIIFTFFNQAVWILSFIFTYNSWLILSFIIIQYLLKILLKLFNNSVFIVLFNEFYSFFNIKLKLLMKSFSILWLLLCWNRFTFYLKAL